ncbi:MAG: PH domain-containing protein [Gemmatimonadota bacterium]|nr:PH domain-containing protein [Gemmatimonadota bacterium]
MTQVFPIPPATGKSVWFLVGVMVLLIGLCVMLSWVAWSTRHSRAEVTPEGLKLVGDLWGRTIPHEQLILDNARIVDLRGEPDLQPRARTMGTGLGGFAAGWFRLQNQEKALIYLTDRTRVVYLPTDQGYSVMLSSAEPERLLAALRAN